MKSAGMDEGPQQLRVGGLQLPLSKMSKMWSKGMSEEELEHIPTSKCVCVFGSRVKSHGCTRWTGGLQSWTPSTYPQHDGDGWEQREHVQIKRA